MSRSIETACGLLGLAVVLTCGPSTLERPIGPAAPGMDAPLDREAQRWVDETLASLSLREKAAQLVVTWIPGGYVSTASAEFDSLARRVVDLGIGGVSISIGQPYEFAAKLNALQRRARVPLLVTADFESGGPGMRLSGVYAIPSLLSLGGGTMLPPTMAFGAAGDERLAYELGRITGLEARAVGVHQTFAPVLDVNSDPENPIINTRSFGEDPQLVAALGAAFIAGAHSAGLLTTAKHYPGHGDTHVDSHIELPTIDATREHLDRVELVPFREAVEAGVDAVMTAHIAAPAILGPDAPPATLSDYFLQRILREELRFEGVVFTDAMRMGAIVSRYGVNDAAVLALEAGADVILAPGDLEGSIEALTAAVRSGQVSGSRLDASVRRVLQLKARAGLHKGRLVDLRAIGEVVGRQTHLEFADTVAERSITLVRDHGRLLPIDTTETRRVLSVVFARREDPIAARAFHQTFRPYFEWVDPVWVSYETHPASYDSLTALADSADLVTVSAYVGPRSGSGTVALTESVVEFVNDLMEAGKPVILLSFGNPYLLADMPEVGTYLIAWGGREVSQRAAVRALMGAAPISGRLPISIPPFHRVGDGLQRPRSMAGIDE